MFGIEDKDGEISVYVNGRPVIKHSEANPFLTVGRTAKQGGNAGKPVPLSYASYDEEHTLLRFAGGGLSISFALSDQDGRLVMSAQRCTPGIGTVRMDFPGAGNANVYGGGEQYVSENIKGRKYLLHADGALYAHRGARWTVETAFGLRGGGDYPQPAFVVNSTLYYIDTQYNTELDFRNQAKCGVKVSGIPEKLIIAYDRKQFSLSKHLSEIAGAQPAMPSWCANGAWMDVQGGRQVLEDCLSKAVTGGLKISCIVIRDWSGSRSTSGGGVPFWDWLPSPELYPALDQMLGEFNHRGIRALAYINPHLSIEGRFFAEGSAKGYLVRRQDGGVYVSDIGGVMAGHLDMTNPAAEEWYKQIIRNNVLKTGFSGYVADLCQALPENAVLFDKSEPGDMHNRWPALWAKLNREAINGFAASRDFALVLCSGYAGAAAYAPLALSGANRALWGFAGGLRAAFNASLSLAWSGYGASYAMIGGAKRGLLTFDERELMMRWSEFAAFTPVMHAAFGGKARGVCVDEDVETLRHFTRMAAIHDKLAPYLNACAAENKKNGIPVMRPLDMAFTDENRASGAAGQYMLGPDLMIAPVLFRGRRERGVVFPKGKWISLWSGKEYEEGKAQVPAPLGKPPVFYPTDSRYTEFFLSLKTAVNP